MRQRRLRESGNMSIASSSENTLEKTASSDAKEVASPSVASPPFSRQETAFSKNTINDQAVHGYPALAQLVSQS